MEEMEKSIEFLKEIEQLKHVDRRVFHPQADRMENSAEHSWHVAMFVLLFAENFENVNRERLLKLALIHDLVEIYAGDTYAFDEEGRKSKKERESAAAQRLFSTLPSHLREEFHELFDEFETRATAEARIINSFDKLQTWTQILANDGYTWEKLGLDFDKLDKYHGPSMKHHPFIEELYDLLTREARDRKLL